MSRSQKKGPFVDEKLYRKVMAARDRADFSPIKTWSRRCTIVPEFVGQKFAVHNGKQFMQVAITEEMVGHKLGEFSPTRMFKGHAGSKKR